ncbi:MAG: DMT(Drug/metabolite transporter) superfamily permease [Candidatus Daviesbacteria bacterium GW2011_GWB1_41_5]|uniref:DMT(Drug/metabolite transporter) superfamily permease n=1 Tax=Candidatus Daviesbacteria bacterium GW2011_GWB1_41_5 TaxID=1618429 RepID=A0A0G0ZK46_9BACT|nr:MAG: DMT(Drug/metabolite transporter) superfamily permease [Candidatus Daviesbacteria bacterium GW2011_GWB1_41_5]
MSSDILKKSWPYVAIILAHIIWGLNFLVAKLTLAEFPPMTLAFLRFFLATLLLVPFLLAEKKIKIEKVDLPKLICVGILMASLNIAFFYMGLSRTTVIDASVLTMVIPIISVLGGWVILREKVYSANLIGIILGLGGTIAVIGIPLLFLGVQISASMMLGNFLIILASVSWVSGAILSKTICKKYSTLIITTAIFLTGAVTFLIPALLEYLQNPGWISQVTYLGIFGLVFITIGASICSYFLFEWGLARVGVIKADLFQYIEPAVAVTLGVLILNEQLRFSFIIGGLLIAIGVYWSTLLKKDHKHHRAHRV